MESLQFPYLIILPSHPTHPHPLPQSLMLLTTMSKLELLETPSAVACVMVRSMGFRADRPALESWLCSLVAALPGADHLAL